MLKSRHRKMPAFSMSLPDEPRPNSSARRSPRACGSGDVVGLKGELGSGKTTLARAILRAAAGDPALIVPSPTFTLVEVYETPRGTFWHFDLYRLETPEQVFELGWEEALAEGIVADRMAGAARPAAAQASQRDLEVDGDGRRALLDV